MELPVAVVVFASLAVVALFSVEARRPLLHCFAKPAATLALLLVTGIPLHDRFGALIVVGIGFSALGDVALLSERAEAFLLGLILFLVAQLSYTAAFLGGGKTGVWMSSGLLGAVVIGVATWWLLGRLWPSIERGLRLPALLYGLTISAMVGSAYLVLAGPWPERLGLCAVTGAVLFYLSDAVLAWDRWKGQLPHGRTATLFLYWAGQLGIALAARWGTGGA